MDHGKRRSDTQGGDEEILRFVLALDQCSVECQCELVIPPNELAQIRVVGCKIPLECRMKALPGVVAGDDDLGIVLGGITAGGFLRRVSAPAERQYDQKADHGQGGPPVQECAKHGSLLF